MEEIKIALQFFYHLIFFDRIDKISFFLDHRPQNLLALLDFVQQTVQLSSALIEFIINQIMKSCHIFRCDWCRQMIALKISHLIAPGSDLDGAGAPGARFWGSMDAAMADCAQLKTPR